MGKKHFGEAKEKHKESINPALGYGLTLIFLVASGLLVEIIVSYLSVKILMRNPLNPLAKLFAFNIALFVFLQIGLTGCIHEEQSAEDVIARVNSRILTATDVAAWEASLGMANVPNVPNDLRLSYIRHWVEKELLFEEAIKRELMNDPWVAEKIEKTTRALLTSRLLEYEWNKLPPLSPADVRAYYQEHSSEFVWYHEHLGVQYWKSPEAKPMNTLRENFFRGNRDAIWTGNANSLEQGKLSLEDNKRTDPKLWRSISRLKEGQVSQVIHYSNDSWIFILNDRSQPGERKELTIVRDEITARLSEERRQKHREGLIRSLVIEYRRDGRLIWSDADFTVSISDNRKQQDESK